VQHLSTTCSLLLLSLSVSACAVYEALGGMPYAEAELQLSSQVTTERSLGCVRSSILALSPVREVTSGPGVSFRSKEGMWSTEVTRIDYERGVLETGNFPASNIVGVRVRAVYVSSSSLLRLQVKAAGHYYADLGAPEHLAKLRSAITKCVEA